jgi:hypothetical protein
MSKELDTLNTTNVIVEINNEVTQLDNLSLALVGGGELVVAN